MILPIKKIANDIHGKIIGDENFLVKGVCDIEKGKIGYLSYIKNSSYLKFLSRTKASVILIDKKINTKNIDKTFIRVENPGLAFISILDSLKFMPNKKSKISKKALIGQNVTIGKNVTILDNAHISNNVKLGNNTTIYPGCFVGEKTEIGSSSIIYSNVVLYDHVFIGNNCSINSGTIIGADGFGIIKDKNKIFSVPHIGKVIIEDNVTIGANCCIDRGTINNTIIKENSKLDNLVQVGHNVSIGRGCVIAAQVGIGGSSKLGDFVSIAGQTGIVDHVTIGKESTVGAKSMVCNSLDSNSFVSGVPANIHKNTLKQYIALKKLPKLIKKIRDE